MFEIKETKIPGCYEIVLKPIKDKRGQFIKTFHELTFKEHNLATDFAEEYYSISARNVLRGMHFQLPPHDHEKIVYCPAGKALDVVLDLRKGSPAFGKYESFELSPEKCNMIYIPRGLAHGFYSQQDNTQMFYKVTTAYVPESDSGVRWDSAKIDWPCKDPVISDKDDKLVKFKDFDSPFTFEE
ncbi:MAG: dTDP-4-dehydrorhamnose 3,5-epimerase [Sedimentisphaerales bacterium]|nr:dTDP-4-dehydrorhamnose 3,5-epimerase [Sedimentisphaerales bacterium]